MAPAHALASHAAIGGEHQTLGRDVLERLANKLRHLLRCFNLKRVVIHDADTYLLILDATADDFQIHSARAAGFERDHVSIHLVQCLDGRRVARLGVEQALCSRIAPAGMTPDFRLRAQPAHGAVKHLDHEIRVEQAIHQALSGQEMDLRLF